MNKNRLSSSGGLPNNIQNAKPHTKLRFAIRDAKQFDKNNPELYEELIEDQPEQPKTFNPIIIQQNPNQGEKRDSGRHSVGEFLKLAGHDSNTRGSNTSMMSSGELKTHVFGRPTMPA